MDKTPVQEYKLLRICLACNFSAALVFMVLIWKFFPAESLPGIYAILAVTLLYSGVLYRWANPRNHRLVALIFLGLLVLLDTTALLLHPPQYRLIVYLLLSTFIIVFNVLLVGWPELLVTGPILWLWAGAVMAWPASGLRAAMQNLGMDATFATAAVMIYGALILILGTGLVQVKRRTEGQLRFINQNLNRLVAEKAEQIRRADQLASLGIMAAGLTHEINSPLSVLKVYCHSLEKGLPPEKQKQVLGIMHNNITRIERITKNFLSFAREEKPKKEWIDIRQVLKGSLEMATHLKRFRNLRMETDLAADLPLIFADQHKLDQVFVNLLNNACDVLAGQDGRLDIRCFLRGREIIIQFQDNGRGIKAEHLPHIFTPFFTTKERGHGTGLGLSISFGIIQEHGGTIGVESRENAGTTFTIRLPVPEPPAQPA